ncbi:hypothetical protein KEM60_03287 [Austwickia sp. TVS 96-490-7B]|nr:hypothetical protein [Austwickia sp. TVS 96-490-7B]
MSVAEGVDDVEGKDPGVSDDVVVGDIGRGGWGRHRWLPACGLCLLMFKSAGSIMPVYAVHRIHAAPNGQSG